MFTNCSIWKSSRWFHGNKKPNGFMREKPGKTKKPQPLGVSIGFLSISPGPGRSSAAPFWTWRWRLGCRGSSGRNAWSGGPGTARRAGLPTGNHHRTTTIRTILGPSISIYHGMFPDVLTNFFFGKVSGGT